MAKEHCCNITSPRGGKTVYIGSDWKNVTSKEFQKEFTLRAGYEIMERTIDKYGQYLLIPELEVNTWWTNLGLCDQDIIDLYHAHGECEQFHSEIKSDMAVERLPSGKFETNALILELTMIAYNILRTVISNLVMMACHITTHARQITMGLGKSNVWRHVFADIFHKFTAVTA